MYLEVSSTRNCKHILKALLNYQETYLNDETATGIEQQQFEEVIAAFISAYSSAHYDEQRRAEEQKKEEKAIVSKLKNEIPF